MKEKAFFLPYVSFWSSFFFLKEKAFMNEDKLPLDEFIKKFRDISPLIIPKIPRYIPDVEWNVYLTGRRIVLIGPAEDTKQVLRGRWLKQFDAIARCNRSIPIQPWLFQFIGNRTDIYYNNLNQDEGKNIIVPQTLEYEGVKIVVGSYPPDNDSSGCYQRFIIKKESGQIPYRTVPLSSYNDIIRSTVYRPTTGVLAIYDLLQTNCDFLFVCGFSFFSTPHIDSYQETTIRYSQNIHNMDNEKEFIRQLAYKDSRLILDQSIRNILWHNEYDTFYKCLAQRDGTLEFPSNWDPFHSIWVFNTESMQITLFHTTTSEIVWTFMPTPYLPYILRKNAPEWFPYWWAGFSQIFLNMVFLHNMIFMPKDRYVPIIWKSLGNVQCDVQIQNIQIWDFLRATQMSLWVHQIKECLEIEERRYFFAESPS